MSGCHCGGEQDGREMVDKLRSKGFSQRPMPQPVTIVCSCLHEFQMETLEARCPQCGMVYGVTPCSAADSSRISPAGIDY